MTQEYFYDIIIGYNDGTPIIEQRTLTITTEIKQCDDTVYNPTGDENAYCYGISIDGGAMQHQTFAPGLEGHQPMNEGQAHKYLGEAIIQTINNYQAYAK